MSEIGCADDVRLRNACGKCSLQELCLPLGIDPQQLAELDDILTHVGPVNAGDILFHEGDPLRCLYVVSAGMVKTRRIDPAGREHVLGFHLAAELFGLDAIYSRSHRCDAVALDTVTVCAFPYDRFLRLTSRVPALQQQLLRLLSREIVALEGMSGSFKSGERIAALIMSLVKRLERRGQGSGELVLTMSRQDIASYLSLATETVSREMSKLHRHGLLDVKRRRIRVLDRPALAALGRCLQGPDDTHDGKTMD